MFWTLVLAAWTALHAYVAWRASSVPAVARCVRGRTLAAVAAALWSSLLVSRFVLRDDRGFLALAFDTFGVHWLAVLFLSACSLLAVDVVTAFGRVLRPVVPRLRGGALVAGGALSVVALVQGLRPPVVEEFEVRLPHLPAEADGTVIVAISDLHVGTLIGETWLAARVEQVNALRPDLVVAIGDILEGDEAADREREVAAVFRRIVAPLGVWAVTGNHDAHHRSGFTARLMGDSGIRLLDDAWAVVRPGLVLAGVQDPGHGAPPDGPGGTDGITRAFGGRPAGAATVFLSHRPRGVEEAARLGAGLMLAGHTHGGQIWPFTYVSNYVNGWAAGRHEVGGMTLVVSRGAGTWGPRMRLWPPGEIVRITLRGE